MKNIQISIPAMVSHEKYEDGRESWTVFGDKETEKILGYIPIGSSWSSEEEAKKRFLKYITVMNEFHAERSDKLDRYIWFEKGPWDSTGGRWFTILGLNFHFRYGKGMKGGRYIPFTKLNISFHNYWRKRKNDEKQTT